MGAPLFESERAYRRSRPYRCGFVSKGFSTSPKGHLTCGRLHSGHIAAHCYLHGAGRTNPAVSGGDTGAVFVSVHTPARPYCHQGRLSSRRVGFSQCPVFSRPELAVRVSVHPGNEMYPSWERNTERRATLRHARHQRNSESADARFHGRRNKNAGRGLGKERSTGGVAPPPTHPSPHRVAVGDSNLDRDGGPQTCNHPIRRVAVQAWEAPPSKTGRKSRSRRYPSDFRYPEFRTCSNLCHPATVKPPNASRGTDRRLQI